MIAWLPGRYAAWQHGCRVDLLSCCPTGGLLGCLAGCDCFLAGGHWRLAADLGQNLRIHRGFVRLKTRDNCLGRRAAGLQNRIAYFSWGIRTTEKFIFQKSHPRPRREADFGNLPTSRRIRHLSPPKPHCFDENTITHLSMAVWLFGGSAVTRYQRESAREFAC